MKGDKGVNEAESDKEIRKEGGRVRIIKQRI